MVIRKVARMGHPVLRTPAVAVTVPATDAVHALAADMVATMREEDGVGLAAPQVHESLRVIAIDAAGSTTGHDRAGASPAVLLNPGWRALDDGMETGREGCLSIPGLVGEVPRASRIRYWGWTVDGMPVDTEASGFHARVVQHECDHLDGVLFIERMTDLTTLSLTTELRRTAPEQP